MKCIIKILVVLLISSLTSCGQDYQMTYTVITDDGTPVPEAVVSVSTFDHNVPGEAFGKDVDSQTSFITDPRGVAVLKSISKDGMLYFSVRKEGFYPTTLLKYRFLTHSAGRWEPWNPRMEAVVRQIINPRPLMAKSVGLAGRPDGKIPVFGEPVGYDFEVGDWAAPHGKGVHKDIIFQLDGHTTDYSQPYEAQLRVSFNHPLDGLVLYEAPAMGGSDLHMPHKAPETGYQPVLTRRSAKVPSTDKLTRDWIYIDETNKTHNYFVRTRTQVNEKGEIISANYAKIYRDIQWGPSGLVQFQYYFNPDPNDRNLEFDIRKNLLPEEFNTIIGEP